MSKIEWDIKTGGVVLKRHISKETLSVSPRPVFYEELDLLKMEELGWKYPRCKEPLLWACNKQYFYRGQLVLKQKEPMFMMFLPVVFQKDCENLKLKPVDVEAMLKKNFDEMFLIESEAIEFIREQYLKYANASNTRKGSKGK